MEEFPHKWKDFILLGHLASGGMADIYVAVSRHKKHHNQFLVIKRMRKSQATPKEMVAMFNIEYKTLKELNCKNIVSVFDSVISDVDQSFIAMEYVKGLSLKEITESSKLSGATTISVEVVLEIIKQVASALSSAHSHVHRSTGTLETIIHRDISPHNILISSSGFVKLIDFGVAKAEHLGSATQFTGQIKGKLTYMSPEQLEGNLKLDARTDFYSLGVVAWELLIGKRFYGDIDKSPHLSEEALGRLIEENQSLLSKKIERELSDFINRLISSRRDERPSSANEIVQFIEKYQKLKNLKQGYALLKEYIENNFALLIAHQENELKTLALNAGILFGSNDEQAEIEATTVSNNFSRNPLKALYASLAIMSIVGAIAFFNLPKIPLNNPRTKNIESREPASIPFQPSEKTKQELKKLDSWIQRELGSNSRSVLAHWERVYKKEEKTKNPREFAQKFFNLEEVQKEETINKFIEFKESFSTLNDDASKIELINKYEDVISILPLPKRNVAQP